MSSRIQFFTGDTRDPRMVEILEAEGWGRTWIDRRPRQGYDGEPWMLDNGAFVWWKRGEAFREDLFEKRLRKAVSLGVEGCQVAVLPDAIGVGFDASVDFSLSWLDRCCEIAPDYPWYLVVQDSTDETWQADYERVHRLLQDEPRIAGLFLGGAIDVPGCAWQNPLKHSIEAGRWASLAHLHGRRFHYGRATNFDLLRQAEWSQVDSCDSACWLWKRERIEALRRRPSVTTGADRGDIRSRPGWQRAHDLLQASTVLCDPEMSRQGMDLMLQAIGLNAVFLLAGCGVFLRAFRSARERGLLMRVGE